MTDQPGSSQGNISSEDSPNPLPSSSVPSKTPSRRKSWTDFDWVWNALTVVFLVGSGAFATTTAQAFAQGNWDVLQTLGTVSQGAGLVFVTGGALTDRGRKAMQDVLTNLGIPVRYQSEVTCLAAAGTLALTYGIHQNLPNLGNYYFHQGQKLFQQGRLAEASTSFEHALNFNPDNIQISIFTGYLEEKSLHYAKAQSFYEKGLAFGLPEALAGMGRTTFRAASPSSIPSLVKAELFFQVALNQPKASDPLRMDILTNLGFVYFLEAEALKQKNPRQWDLTTLGLEGVKDPIQELHLRAETVLKESIVLVNKLDKELAGTGMSYCYLGAVLDASNRLQEAEVAWQDCATKARPIAMNQLQDILYYGGQNVVDQVNTSHIVKRQS